MKGRIQKFKKRDQQKFQDNKHISSQKYYHESKSHSNFKADCQKITLKIGKKHDPSMCSLFIYIYFIL